MQVNIFTEEMIRAGSAASLSSLLNRLDPVLRKTANLGRYNFTSSPKLNNKNKLYLCFNPVTIILVVLRILAPGRPDPVNSVRRELAFQRSHEDAK